jgi:hypothetical protein
MESNLLRSMKYRFFYEIQGVVDTHPDYRDKIRVFHKFPTTTERPNMGILMKNAAASRIKLSADDFAGSLVSHVSLCKVGTFESKFLEWVWEDLTNLSDYKREEDVSSQIDGKTRLITLQHSMISGLNNTVPASNPGQILVMIAGTKVYPEYVDGKRNVVMLPTAPQVGSEVLISYYYKKLTPPGFYYIRLIDEQVYDISPLYDISAEEVVIKATGTELYVNLKNSGIFNGSEKLYTRKNKYSYNIYIENGTDYTIDYSTGIVTLLTHLPVGTNLYANYKWVGAVLGPFNIPEDYHYDNESLPGVSLCFGSQKIVGDQMVVVVYENRELAAQIYSGHWNMSFELEVFGRDPIQLPELTDLVVDGLWARRNDLITEGITIDSLEPTGEIEEVYVEGTNDQYFKCSISLVAITEWKRLKPLPIKLLDFNTSSNMNIKQKEYFVNDQGMYMDTNLEPPYESIDIIPPKYGYPRTT